MAPFEGDVTACGAPSSGGNILVVTAASKGSRIGEFLPTYDVRASYETRINAPSRVVYPCVLGCDFTNLRVVRLLMTIRAGRRLPQIRAPRGLYQRFQGNGFVILAEVPGEELVIGVAGKFLASRRRTIPVPHGE